MLRLRRTSRSIAITIYLKKTEKEFILKKALVLTLVLAAIAAMLLPMGSGQAASQCQKQPLKILFLIDGCCHDFKDLAPILADKLKATCGFECFITADRNELIPAKIAKYDFVLFYTQGSEMTPEQEKGLTEFVAGGKGWAGIHSASDSFKNSDAYFKMVGGRFKGHGNRKFGVHYTVKSHDATKGLADFEIQDETYDHSFHPESKLVVLARRADDGEPAAWVQNYGAGRVFYTGLGHGKEAFTNEGFQKLMMRGICWAAGRSKACDRPVGCCAK